MYSDLKTHLTAQGGLLTAKLWGVADTAPYMQDGSATTLREAILAHSGTTSFAASSFDDLPAGEQTCLILEEASALAAETLLIRGLSKLATSHPNLEVEVVVGSSDIYQDLASGDCDLAVGDEANFASSPYASALRMQPVAQAQLVFVQRAGHPAANASELGQLLHYPLAIPSRYFNENRLFASTALQAIHPRYRLNSLSACLSLAATSDVVTLAPRTVAERLQSTSTQPVINISSLDTGINVRLALVTVARNTPSPAVRAFQQAISTL